MAKAVKRGTARWYEADSLALNNMARKYSNNDQEIFDAMMDLREKLLIRLGKGERKEA